MTKETFKQAQQLLEVREVVANQLQEIEQVLSDAKEDKIKIRVRGLALDLPKAAFRSEVNKKKAGLESQLEALDLTFNSL